MSRIKEIFLYLLALVVLLAPVIILGWIGLTLLGWLGLILGIGIGLAIFVYSVNKVISQDANEEAPPDAPSSPVVAEYQESPGEPTARH